MIEIQRVYTGRFDVFLHRSGQPVLIIGFNLEAWEVAEILQ